MQADDQLPKNPNEKKPSAVSQFNILSWEEFVVWLKASVASEEAEASNLPPPPMAYRPTRAHPRLKFVTLAQVDVGNGSFLCKTADISVGGLGAKYPQPPPASTQLKLLFHLPNGSSVQTDGLVRFVSADRFGVQFVALPARARQALDDYIRRALG